MALRKDLARLACLGILVVSFSGCIRFKGVESEAAANAPNQASPGKGDPYTYGGMAEGTGGLQPTTSHSMEGTSYDGGKFKQAAGTGAFKSSSGHETAPSKPSDVSGDYQPLPHEGKHEEGEGESH